MVAVPMVFPFILVEENALAPALHIFCICNIVSS